jgi:hypothetical protein
MTSVFMQDDSKASQVSNVSQDVLRDFCVQTQSRQSDRLSLQSSELGSPTPSDAGECVPPLVPGEGSLAYGRGGGRTQFGRGVRHCGTLG